jgi:histidinol dehydrogenase
MKIIASSNTRAVRRLLDRAQKRDPVVEEQVTRIVSGVRRRGDRSLQDYARRFDQVTGPLEVSRREMRSGAKQTPPAVRRAIKEAARLIRRVATKQVPKTWRATTVPGVVVEQRVLPLERVGCYVPGGRYPLPSSLLMTALPAQVAGVQEIIAACPRPEPAVLAAALEAGVSRLYRVGGAHIIAAMAYGTESIPKVEKIVGPGNAYVAAAKARVAGDCPIDFYAGPTEIVIVAKTGHADWIAADLVAQAEHDPDARAVLLTPNPKLAETVAEAVRTRLAPYPAARASIRRHGVAIVTSTLSEAIKLSNEIAPEHVVCETEAVARRLTRAGTVFVGPYGAQAAGDYATGSNHVLPTNGGARFRGGLSASDFVRISNVQRLTRAGLQRLAPTAISLANAEGLIAHAASVATRVR